MTKATITGSGGRQLPNLKELGVGWKPALKLLAEQEKLWSEQRTCGLEAQGLQAEIRGLEARQFEERAQGIRTGEPDPDDGALTKARKRAEDLQDRQQLLRRASESSHADLMACVAENREKWRGDLSQRAKRDLADAERAADVFRQAMQRLAVVSALQDWLEEPERFGVATETLVEADNALARVRHGVAPHPSTETWTADVPR